MEKRNPTYDFDTFKAAFAKVDNLMSEQTCHECGHNLVRDVRPISINFKGRSATFDVPGLYCTGCGEGVVSGKDMGVYDKALNRLKTQT